MSNEKIHRYMNSFLIKIKEGKEPFTHNKQNRSKHHESKNV